MPPSGIGNLCWLFCSSLLVYLLSLLNHLPVESLDWFIFGFMVFNATFNNISDISWRSTLVVGETGVPRESHRHDASH